MAVYESDGLDTLEKNDGRSIIRTCSMITESEWASRLCFGVMIVYVVTVQLSPIIHAPISFTSSYSHR